MDRKISFSRMASRIHLIYRLILLSLCSVAVVFADSGKTVTDIESYFSDINSALSTLGQDVALSSIKQAKAPMEKTLQDHPGITTLLRINSKGKVINEAVREGKPGKPNRRLSRQKWFRKIKDLEPYYGSLKTRKGDHLLFWCKPIRITKSGNDRCGGAIVARIDLKRSFDAMTKKTESSFRILQKGQPLFSHSWKASYDTTALPLEIKGLTNLQINVKEEIKVVEVNPPEPTEKKEKVSLLKIIILFVVIGIVLVLIWSIMKYVVKKKEEALIRRIEGDGPFIKPDKSFDMPEENALMKKVEMAEENLPEEKEEDGLIETEGEMPPDEKKEVILEPEESIPWETTVVMHPEELSDAAETKEVMPEPSTLQEASSLDVVPEDTVAIRPDFDTLNRDEKPEEEISKTPEVTAEEVPKATHSSITEEVEALLQKHLNAVLADRMKQIEEDVLARVKDELAGRIQQASGPR